MVKFRLCQQSRTSNSEKVSDDQLAFGTPRSNPWMRRKWPRSSEWISRLSSSFVRDWLWASGSFFRQSKVYSNFKNFESDLSHVERIRLIHWPQRYSGLKVWTDDRQTTEAGHTMISLYETSAEAKIEPPHDKTNKMTCAPNEDSDQPGHPPSLIRAFAFRLKEVWVINYP